MALEIGVHEIMRRGKRGRIDAPITDNDIAVRCYQKSRIEITTRPFGIAIELMATDKNTILLRQCLERFRDWPGNGAASALDPGRNGKSVRANSGIRTSLGGFSPSTAARIKLTALRILACMIDQAASRSAPLTARLLIVWTQVARQGAIAISTYPV
jgi:hypothetical protein